jgi:CHAT domain-containing protein/Tfp pilus assembly protein PilF
MISALLGIRSLRFGRVAYARFRFDAFDSTVHWINTFNCARSDVFTPGPKTETQSASPLVEEWMACGTTGNPIFCRNPFGCLPTFGQQSMTSRGATAVVVLILAISQRPFGQASDYALAKGVIVESVSKNTEAARAGVQAGDILLLWSRGEARGNICSPFDLPYIRFQEASRGVVTVFGLRANQQRTWHLGSDVWGIASRPNLPDPLLRIYREGEELLAAGKPIQAADRWRVSAAHAQQYGAPWLGPWLLSRAGQVLFEAEQWDAADEAYSRAIVDADSDGPIVKAELLRQRAAGFGYRDDLITAERYYQAVLLEWQSLGRETMTVSNTLLLLADIDLSLGELDRAEERLTLASAVAEKLAPTSYQATLIFADLGVLFEDRGELKKAEKYYLKALINEQKYFPDSLYLARTLTAVGTLAHQRGDFGSAETYYRRALTVVQKLDPDSLDAAEILSDLGECSLEQHNPVRAEQYQKRALSIRSRIAPGSFANALSLARLGAIVRTQGDLSGAEEYYRQALTIAARVNAPAREIARLIIGEAEVLRDRRDYPRVEELYRQALGVIQRVAPESMDYGETLADLAGTLRDAGRLDVAAQLYEQAFGVLEKKALYLTEGTDERARYRGRQSRYYQEYADVLLRLGEIEAAFRVVEGSRARSLLEMLTQTQVDVAQSADPVMRERQHKLRQQLNAKSEYRTRLAVGAHADQLTGLDSEIGILQLQYKEEEAQLRVNNPAYAALTELKPPSLPEIQKLLDPDTLLLEYSLGEERSYIWAVTENSLAAFELPQRVEIEKAARRVYGLLTFRNRSSQARISDLKTAEPEYIMAARSLSQMVLGPVERLLAGRRLLIVSDGALQYIPFAALPAPGKNADAVPLVVKHEIVNLPSASVLGELRRQRMGRRKAPRMVAVLADPVFDSKDERLKLAGPEPHFALRSAQYTGDLNRSANDVGLTRNGKLYLNRLLYSRNEADAVMAVTPPGKGMEALDFRASRAIATSAALAQYRVVHFATHGILNNKHPELSGLVLSLVNAQGKAQNGFLKLQDVYNLKLPVDLVVLSGCETGLGEEIHGEGLIGLTRGFMYAGASRVVASLWSVSDMATAKLMAEFYRAMEHDGMPPAAALRKAQIRMWRQREWKSPYYWAAFQIQGEWQ